MTGYTYHSGKEFALELDRRDNMAGFRREFFLPENRIYLVGNSLGLISKRAERSLLEVMEDWKQKGIDGWVDGKYPWFTMAEKLGELLSPLVGAFPDEVIVTGSTTINLHQLIASFYKPEGKRTKILADALAFPSDIYAMQSQLVLHGYDPEKHLIKVPSPDHRILSEEDIYSSMTDEIALVILPTVLYTSGQLLNVKRITDEAHKRGIVIGFDAAHSVGAVPHAFHDMDVDFAFWCHYKYMNGGPGACGGLYVHRKHHHQRPGLAGWFGSDKTKQFDMEHQFIPAQSAGAYQVGSPHILNMAPLIGSLSLFAEASVEKVRDKSLQLTQYLMDLVDHELQGLGFVIANPREADQRGGHVSLEHEEAVRISKSLKELGVIADFRRPNTIRLAPVSFYTSYLEVWESIRRLKVIMGTNHYEKFEKERNIVP